MIAITRSKLLYNWHKFPNLPHNIFIGIRKRLRGRTESDNGWLGRLRSEYWLLYYCILILTYNTTVDRSSCRRIYPPLPHLVCHVNHHRSDPLPHARQNGYPTLPNVRVVTVSTLKSTACSIQIKTMMTLKLYAITVRLHHHQLYLPPSVTQNRFLPFLIPDLCQTISLRVGEPFELHAWRSRSGPSRLAPLAAGLKGFVRSMILHARLMAIHKRQWIGLLHPCRNIWISAGKYSVSYTSHPSFAHRHQQMPGPIGSLQGICWERYTRGLPYSERTLTFWPHNALFRQILHLVLDSGKEFRASYRI